MLHKPVLTVFILCVTVLTLAWMYRGSLCEIQVRNGKMEVVASLAYESVR
ncbi:Hok/Gef family protein [Rouxiella sp. S1S-2]|nr:Hok/Gef family protein [Rouxiella sp. S1S-2]KAB7893299.1 Hok/Gef family protein [Rouxiella sp. S1S-2]